jgi:sRNA-binding regulator protein Hfq
MKKWIQLSLILPLFFSMTSTDVVEGGTVFLKNGHVVNGKVIASDEEKVILTWSNGRATIYRRFISEVVLESSEQEYLSRRLAARKPQVAAVENTHIQLPELADLLPIADADSGDLDSVEDSSEVLDPIEVVVEQIDSTTELAQPVAVELVPVESPLPVFHTEQLTGLNLTVDIPETWTSISAQGAARISGEDGAVLIALDRYIGNPDKPLTSEVAANSLGDRLETAGFVTKPSDRAAKLTPLRTFFSQESTSPDGQQSCIHALIPSQDGTLLISIYSPILTDRETDEVISIIVASLESPIALR